MKSIKEDGVFISDVFQCTEFNKVFNSKREWLLGKYFALTYIPMTEEEKQKFIHGNKNDPSPYMYILREINKEKHDELQARLVVENMEIEEKKEEKKEEKNEGWKNYIDFSKLRTYTEQYIIDKLVDEYRRDKIFYNQISTHYSWQNFLEDKGLLKK